MKVTVDFKSTLAHTANTLRHVVTPDKLWTRITWKPKQYIQVWPDARNGSVEQPAKNMKCPRCQSPFSSVEYDGVKVEVCSQCKGEWLYAGELQKIVEHHDEVFTPEEINSLAGVNKEIFTAEIDDHDELNCPACGKVRMEHFNYGDTSGIILHKCPQCGGIWTDKDQLEKVEELVDGWKADLDQDTAKYGPILEKVEIEEQKELDRAVSISRFGFVNCVLRRFCEG